jgi:cysteinyl-tRNA synthetase
LLKLFNTFGKRLEAFKPTKEKVVNIFTCGPSVYQRSHIGNFRTFLFEDILLRYLEYRGYRVNRGMNFTDVEDKAIEEAKKRNVTVRNLTQENIKGFLEEMDLLRMKIPDYLPHASKKVDEAVEIIEKLLDLKIAYWHKGNVYFDPLKYPRFGELFGLSMSRWPKQRRRFHKDTYPGMRWNLGDFILWHGGQKAGSVYWKTRIGKGRPSWNIQDASMIIKHIAKPLSIYCGGIDNLYRHHDYTRAILESVRPYPMAPFWLHCHHLVVNGQKMSKSLGNIYYTDTVLNQGYDISELRFFLLYGHYRKKLDYSKEAMDVAAAKLRQLKEKVRFVERRGQQASGGKTNAEEMEQLFIRRMDDDLDLEGAFDGLHEFLTKIDVKRLKPGVASGYTKALRKIDEVLRVIF